MHSTSQLYNCIKLLTDFKLKPAIFPLFKHVIRFHELPSRPYNRALMDDWSLSGIMTSKLVIRKSESPRPAASSILISRMTINHPIQRILKYCMNPNKQQMCNVWDWKMTHLLEHKHLCKSQ